MSSPTILSPKEHLRCRRPEIFSDSRPLTAPVLDRTTLEYHLDTLTSRNQESDFQNFALKLAQCVICPNLRPQTGPTGGGDSKADAETFPVSDQLSLAWFVGTGESASSERWAFAFSTKKQWKEKVQSDIRKISKTGRGYKRAFFISSQFIRDKGRAATEDELSNECSLTVVILDRNWILDQVLSRKFEQLAITELRINTTPIRVIEEGPLDIQRKRELADADRQVEAILSSNYPGPLLAVHAVEAARLSRELELPRAEVEGRYLRAIELAKRYGTDRHKAEAVYQYAWTTFFWHEDYQKFSELYSDVEKQAKDSDNVSVIKLLSNLWHLLFFIHQKQGASEEKIQWNQRTAVLSQELYRFSQAEHMPSAALDAQAMLLVQQVAATAPNVIPALFGRLKSILEQSDGLVGFPVQQLIEIIIELGQIFEDSPDYDDLYRSALLIIQKRVGEIAYARACIRRGKQKLDGKCYFDAITLAGTASIRLWRHDTRTDLLFAFCICAIAYEEIGLLWAARGTLLNAASVVSNGFKEDHQPEVLQIGSFSRIKWLVLLC